MIRIELLLEGKRKTFSLPFVSTRALRGAVELSERINADNISADTVDELIGWLVDIFKHQFTVDDALDGLPADRFLDTIMKILNDVVGEANKKANSLPNFLRGIWRRKNP